MPRPRQPEPSGATPEFTRPPRLDLQQLRCFVAVADELNFTRAAARVGIVQSALSHQIAQLERDHRITLFERTSRTVRLAPAGATLLPLARHILTAVDRTQAELQQLAGLVTGRLRIGTITGAATGVEAGLVRFHRRYPAVTLTVRDTHSAGLLDRLLAGDIDLAAVDLNPDEVPDQLTYHALSTEPLVLVAAEALLRDLPADRPVTPATLIDLGSTVELPVEHGLRRRVDDLYAGAARRVAFEVSDLAGLLRYVGLGIGYGIVPLSAAGQSDLGIRQLRDPAACYRIGLLHRGPQPSAPAAQAFLADLFGATPSPTPGGRAPVSAPHDRPRRIRGLR